MCELLALAWIDLASRISIGAMRQTKASFISVAPHISPPTRADPLFPLYQSIHKTGGGGEGGGRKGSKSTTPIRLPLVAQPQPSYPIIMRPPQPHLSWRLLLPLALALVLASSFQPTTAPLLFLGGCVWLAAFCPACKMRVADDHPSKPT